MPCVLQAFARAICFGELLLLESPWEPITTGGRGVPGW